MNLGVCLQKHRHMGAPPGNMGLRPKFARCRGPTTLPDKFWLSASRCHICRQYHHGLFASLGTHLAAQARVLYGMQAHVSTTGQIVPKLASSGALPAPASPALL